MTNIVKQQAFDYEMLDRQTQITVKQKTFEIKDLIRQTAQDIIETGQKLTEVKQQLKHGQFRIWLESEFNWSISSATKFMQVSSQFNNVNLSDLNFATSALYLLAAPSTPESARQYALEIANQGENVTYSLAKSIIKYYRDSSENDSYNLNKLNSITTGRSIIQQVPVSVEVTYQDVTEKLERPVRILAIKQENPQNIEDRIQDFEIAYAGICVVAQGCPEDLTVLFKQMQNNPQFAEEILGQARLNE